MARRKAKPLVKPGASVLANARRIVTAQTAAFFAYEHALENADASTELHEMRIAAKRLRYTLELFGAVLGPDVESCIAVVRKFQEIGGEIHDSDVRAGMLHDYLLARATQHAEALTALAADGALTDIDALKTQARAQANAHEWVAEQVALTAAVGRTLVRRRERYAHLQGRWAEWQTSDLHGRLAALGRAFPPESAEKVRDPAKTVVSASGHEPAPAARPAP